MNNFHDSSTVCCCAYELRIISDIQLSYAMYTNNNNNLTLSWNSTTVDRIHVNEVRISVCAVPVISC